MKKIKAMTKDEVLKARPVRCHICRQYFRRNDFVAHVEQAHKDY